MDKEKLKNRVLDILNENILLFQIKEIQCSDIIGEEGIGLDSLNFLKFLTLIEKEFKIIIEDDYWDYSLLHTFDDLFMYINSKLEGDVWQ